MEAFKKKLNCKTENDRTAKFPFDETLGPYTAKNYYCVLPGNDKM